MAGLILRAEDFASPVQWRWLLTEEDTGRRLDSVAGEFEACTDLYRFLRRNAVPDRRTGSEAEIVARAGAYRAEAAGGSSFGPDAGAARPRFRHPGQRIGRAGSLYYEMSLPRMR